MFEEKRFLVGVIVLGVAACAYLRAGQANPVEVLSATVEKNLKSAATVAAWKKAIGSMSGDLWTGDSESLRALIDQAKTPQDKNTVAQILTTTVAGNVHGALSNNFSRLSAADQKTVYKTGRKLLRYMKDSFGLIVPDSTYSQLLTLYSNRAGLKTTDDFTD